MCINLIISRIHAKKLLRCTQKLAICANRYPIMRDAMHSGIVDRETEKSTVCQQPSSYLLLLVAWRHVILTSVTTAISTIMIPCTLTLSLSYVVRQQVCNLYRLRKRKSLSVACWIEWLLPALSVACSSVSTKQRIKYFLGIRWQVADITSLTLLQLIASLVDSWWCSIILLLFMTVEDGGSCRWLIALFNWVLICLTAL